MAGHRQRRAARLLVRADLATAGADAERRLAVGTELDRRIQAVGHGRLELGDGLAGLDVEDGPAARKALAVGAVHEIAHGFQVCVLWQRVEQLAGCESAPGWRLVLPGLVAHAEDERLAVPGEMEGRERLAAKAR